MLSVKDEEPILVIEPPVISRLLKVVTAFGMALLLLVMLSKVPPSAMSAADGAAWGAIVLILVVDGYLNLFRFHRVQLLADRIVVRKKLLRERVLQYDDAVEFVYEKRFGIGTRELALRFRDGYTLSISGEYSKRVVKILRDLTNGRLGSTVRPEITVHETRNAETH